VCCCVVLLVMAVYSCKLAARHPDWSSSFAPSMQCVGPLSLGVRKSACVRCIAAFWVALRVRLHWAA
jgi:hypothetical protein